MRFPVPIPCLAGRLAPIALTVATALALPTSAVAQPTVHVAYIVPSNRTPQTNAVRNLQELMPTMQSWYAEQMDRYGFGRKTFRYETEADGVTPKIHVLRVAATDAQIRNTDSTLYLNNAVDAAESAGFLGAQPNRIVILVTETQTQQANGTFLGNISVGGGAGNVDGAGVALLSAESIPFVRPSLLNDNRSLSGVIFPELGPRPLVPGFEDYTFSGVASTWQGAYAHELGHAFGLDHDFRNDQNRHGNLMGNGFRGWRASFFPDAYLTDDIQLSYVAALKLNANRHLDPLRQYSPNSSPPRVTMQEVGMVNTTAGHLEIHFTATDADGFRSVVLEGPDGPVDEMPITGTNVSGVLRTPTYATTRQQLFLVRAYDSEGNYGQNLAFIQPVVVGQRAPQPFVSVFPSIADVGDRITLDASSTTDPDSFSNTLLVEWDFENDGVFDTAPSTNKAIFKTFSELGTRLIRARITDQAGAHSLSTPIAVRIIPEPSSVVLASLAAMMFATAWARARRIIGAKRDHATACAV